MTPTNPSSGVLAFDPAACCESLDGDELVEATLVAEAGGVLAVTIEDEGEVVGGGVDAERPLGAGHLLAGRMAVNDEGRALPEGGPVRGIGFLGALVRLAVLADHTLDANELGLRPRL